MDLEVIQNMIYIVRGQRVMLDYDLAELYQEETKNLKRAVRRNIERFPLDFMFELTKEEFDFLRCKNFTLENQGRGQHPKYLPFAFTEQGIAQLSSVLNSPYAIEINIRIIRAFVAIRIYLANQASISKEIADLWKAINELSEENRKELDNIYLAISELAKKQISIDENASKPRPKIGFVFYDAEKK
jgi:phage regulator Rha-like protein